MSNLLVTNTYAVNSNIIALRIETGQITRGSQLLYEPEPGDSIQGADNDIVYRDGQQIGKLVDEGRIIRIFDTFAGTELDQDWAQDAANYSINGNQPVNVFVKSKISNSAKVGDYAYEFPMEHTVFLEMSAPMRQGESYRLAFAGNQLEETTFTFDPSSVRSEAVHVSHLGFHPDDPSKVAFLSTWMGPQGQGLSYQEGQKFSLVDRQGNSVYDGRIELTKARDVAEDKLGRNYNGTDVYMADFSDFAQVGEYKVVVEGVGTSFSFQIGEDTWEDAFQISMEGMYTQRSGIELTSEFSDYTSPRSFHPDDGLKVYETTVKYSDNKHAPFEALQAGTTGDLIEDAWGGWKDAGDWDRRSDHLEVSQQFLRLAEMFPDYFSGIDLTIPESSNNIADVVDEALWGVDFFKRLQTEDGGIRGGIESGGHPKGQEASWQESQQVFAFAPDAWSSYKYAAVAAQAAYVIKDIAPARAQGYLESAIKAMRWAYAEEPNGDWVIQSERNLAALELYRATGDRRWHDLFLSETVFNDANARAFSYQNHDQRRAAFLYSRLDSSSIDKTVQANAKQALLRKGDANLAAIADTGFKWYKDPYVNVGWGTSNGFADRSDMIRAHFISGDEKYLEGTVLASQFSGGANPDNMSYTTGIGPRQPDDVLFVDSLVTGQEAPKGISIYGPADFNSDSIRYHWSLSLFGDQSDTRPEDWPTAEGFFDFNLFIPSAEYTIMQTMAPTAFAWGYLAAAQADSEPQIQILLEDKLQVPDEPVVPVPMPSNAVSPSEGYAQKESLLMDLTDIDLNNDGQTDAVVRATISVQSFASYNNTAGFYAVDNASGAIVDELTGEVLLPGDEGYSRIALSQRFDRLDLSGDADGLTVELKSGQILAPFIVANSTAEAVLQSESALAESVFFAYETGNVDGFAHVLGRSDGQSIRLSFEDMWDGGDRDFNDFIVSTTLEAV